MPPVRVGKGERTSGSASRGSNPFPRQQKSRPFDAKITAQYALNTPSHTCRQKYILFFKRPKLSLFVYLLDKLNSLDIIFFNLLASYQSVGKQLTGATRTIWKIRPTSLIFEFVESLVLSKLSNASNPQKFQMCKQY